MKHTSATIALLLASTSAALAAEGGPIRTGEHPSFTRVVMEIEPSTEWSLELSPGSAIVVFPGRDLAFTTESVWDKIPRTRVTAITPARDQAGTAVRFDLGCECRVSASFIGARHLALDIRDPGVATNEVKTEGTAPEPENSRPEAENSSDALAEAERLLLEQLERAADQGLIELADPAKSAGDTPPPGGPRTEEAAAASTPNAEAAGPVATDPASAETASPAALRPVARPKPKEADPEEASLLAHLGLPAHRQITATTVFDRDNPKRRAAPAPDPACRTDEALDLARWSDGRPLTDQAADHHRLLVGEFDRPNPAALQDLARLYVRHGLGVEAGAILRSFDAEIADRDLLADLARVVESRPAAGPLARDMACPGRHGLWLALAGQPAMLAAGDHFPSLRSAFEELPLDLRTLIGPSLVARFIDAGQPKEASILLDVAIRSGTPPDEAMRLASGRLAAAEGKLPAAEAEFTTLVESGAPNATEALLALVRTRLDTGNRVPEAWITDLRAVALEQRRGPLEAKAHILTAESLARNDDLRGAFAILVSLAAKNTAAHGLAETIAPRLLAEADIDAVGPAAFAEAVLQHRDLVTTAPGNDPARVVIAGKLLDLGLGNAALDILAPAVDRSLEDAQILAARAHLARNEAAPALVALDGVKGNEAALLRARAQAASGDFAAASASSKEAGAAEAALDYAWLGGEWDQAAGSSEQTRAAMASYMRDREALPAAELATPLTPEAAFAARPPSLERPSLHAARSLIESGNEVQTFVNTLLAQP